MITVQNPTLGAMSRCFALLVLALGISSLAAVDGAHPLQCSGGACTCNSAADCPAGLACDPSTHACTQACSAASCNGGCCHNGFCAPGTSNNACGAGGGVCAVCGGNTPTCTSTIGGGVCAASGQGTKPQAGSAKKLNANPGEPCCAITSINTASGVVSAKDNSTGQSFRFFVRDSALLNSLKEGQGVVIDFQTQQVFTRAGANGQGVHLGGILGGSYGNTSFGPVDGARPAGPVDGARPVGPIDGAKPVGPIDGAHPVGPIDGARPVGPIDGARPAGPGSGTNIGPIDGSRPLGPVDGAKPLRPVDGARPIGPVNGAKPLGPVDGSRPIGPVDGAHAASSTGGANLGPVDGAHPGNAANPGEPCCAITSINPVTGVVSAKNNSSGQSFQFTVRNSGMLGSLKIGQAVFANFSNRQVFLDGNTFAGNITSVGH